MCNCVISVPPLWDFYEDPGWLNQQPVQAVYIYTDQLWCNHMLNNCPITYSRHWLSTWNLHKDKSRQTNSLHQFTINATSRFHTHKTKPPFHQQKPPHRVCWGKFHLHLDTCIEHHWGRCLSRGIIRRQELFTVCWKSLQLILYITDSSITYWQIYYWDYKPLYSSEHWWGVYRTSTYLDCTIALISIP